MMRTTGLATLGSVFLASTAMPAMAQDRVFSFALRGGVGAAPEYPGADSYRVNPDIGFTFGQLKIGRLDIGNGVRGQRTTGFGVRGAFKVIGDRDGQGSLDGLRDIDTAVELGLGLTYRAEFWEVFGELRQGFGGHSGLTGTVGADVVYKPMDRLTITAGPRLEFGDSDFADTYFGISPGDAATSAFNEFNADGGLLGAGFQVEAVYTLNDRWAIEGAVSYDRLLNDASNDSPITSQGSEDQFRIRLGLSRVFNLRF